MIFKLLLIYVVLLPLMRTVALPALANRIQLSDVVFLSLFFLWAKQLIKNHRLPQDPGLNKPFLFFLLFCLLSFSHSTNLLLSTIELLGLIYLFVMLNLVVDTVNEKRKIDIITKTWIATVGVVAALGFIGWGIMMVFGKENPFCEIYAKFPYISPCYRARSTFPIAPALGNYLVTSVGFVISDLLLTQNKHYRLFLKITLFFICLAALANVSRSVLSLAIVLFLIYNHFYLTDNLKSKIIRFVSINFIIIVFCLSFIGGSTFYILSRKIKNLPRENHYELTVNINYAADPRLARKLAALEMFKRYPFSGVGLAMYPSYIRRLNEEDFFKKQSIYIYNPFNVGFTDFLIISDPHCDILGYLAETGILGAGAFIFFIATLLYRAVKCLRKKATENRYLEVRLFCFLASFIGILIDSIDVDVFKARHLWFLMALILVLARMSEDKVKSGLELTK